jgi:hypothetical protein
MPLPDRISCPQNNTNRPLPNETAKQNANKYCTMNFIATVGFGKKVFYYIVIYSDALKCSGKNVYL